MARPAANSTMSHMAARSVTFMGDPPRNPERELHHNVGAESEKNLMRPEASPCGEPHHRFVGTRRFNSSVQFKTT